MLRVYLFKSLRAVTDTGTPLGLGSPTVRSLLAYLALHRAVPADRRHLAFLLWPQTSEAAARRNLRQYLHRLNMALIPAEHRRPLLLAAEHTVQLAAGDEVWVDVEAFEVAARGNGEGLRRAADLYAGDLLEDLYDDWIPPERERLQGLYYSALERLANHYRGLGRLDDAAATAQRLLAADPLQERGHTLLMALYYARGDRARALQQFKACAQLLADELGVEPHPETYALYQAILSGGAALAGAPRPAASVGFPRTGTVTSSVPPQALVQAPPSLAPRPAPGLHPVPQPLRGSEAAARPFVGRAAELSLVAARLAGLRTGQGGMLLVQGEPGVGKTRLVHEALAQEALARDGEGTRPVRLLAGRGRQFESLAPYQPLIEALSAAAGDLSLPPGAQSAWTGLAARYLPDLAAQLGLPAGPAAAPAERYQLAEALAALILAQAGEGPVVLFIDDAQWAGLPAWELLAYLARRCAGLPLLIVCSVQREELPEEALSLVRSLARQNSLASVDVPRLSPSETAELAAQLGLAAGETLLRRLYEETAGNPFFITELVSALAEAGGEWSIPTDAAGRRPAFAVPLNVREVIEARLERLAPASRGWLAAAAALEPGFCFRDLTLLAGDAAEEALVAALEDWLGRRLVREIAPAGQQPAAGPAGATTVPGAATFGYQFEHELIRRVAYEQMSAPRRRWVHRRIAEAAAAHAGQAAQAHVEIAYHYLRSDAPAQALSYLISAGEQALSVRSYHLARACGQQALGLLGQLPAGAGPRDERLDLNLQLALAHSFAGETERALDILHETESLAAALGDRARLGRTYHRISQVLWRRGQPVAAGEYAGRARRLAEEAGETRLLAAGLRMAARVAIATGAFDDAIGILRQYLGLPPEAQAPHDLPAIYGYLGVSRARVGAWADALADAERGVAHAHSGLSPSATAAAEMHLAFVHAERRAWDACRQATDRGLPLCEEAGFSPHRFMLHVLAGRALCQLGSPAEGRAHIRQALAGAAENEHNLFLHLAHLGLAEALLISEPRETLLAEPAGAAGVALHLAQSAGDRWGQALALRMRAETEQRRPAPDWARAEADLIAARDLFRQTRARPELARTYLSLRRFYERAGQMPWAVDCHFRATGIFEELGMLDELRAAQGSPLPGNTPPPRPAPAAGSLQGPHGG